MFCTISSNWGGYCDASISTLGRTSLGGDEHVDDLLGHPDEAAAPG
jgi:hypothetical protein